MKIPTKKASILLLSIFSAFFLLISASCNRDKCATVVCANNGICNGGACTCPAGYTGANCETIQEQIYFGNWTVFEKGSITNAAQYQISIGATNLITQVVITNFNNYFLHGILANVSGDTIVIPNQQYEGKVVFGTGYIYSDLTYGQYGSISMAYEVVDTATNTVDDYGYYTSVDLSQPSAWNK